MRVFLVSLSAGLGLSLVAAGCGGGGGNPLPTGPTPVAANVEFSFTATPGLESESASKTSDTFEAIDCAGLVLLHPSWWGYAHVTMVAVETNSFGLVFDQVPIGRQSARLTVPEGCGSANLTANGVWLEDRAGTFTFTLHSDGSITP